MRYLVIVAEGARNWGAWSPDVPGCVATGKTREETVQNMREALAFHLEGMAADGDELPEETTLEPGQFEALVVDVAAPAARPAAASPAASSRQG